MELQMKVDLFDLTKVVGRNYNVWLALNSFFEPHGFAVEFTGGAAEFTGDAVEFTGDAVTLIETFGEPHMMYGRPSVKPLELQLAIRELEAGKLIIDGDTVILDAPPLGLEEQIQFELYGWAESLKNLWHQSAKNPTAKRTVQELFGYGPVTLQTIVFADNVPRINSRTITSYDQLVEVFRVIEEHTDVVCVSVDRKVSGGEFKLSYPLIPSRYK